jgi:hypothetical protein
MRGTFMAGAALAAVLAGGAAGDVYADDSEPKPTEHVDCMRYDEVLHREARTLDMRVTNACPKALVCTVTWSVRCAHATTDHSQSEVLAAGGDHLWTASAASCNEEWSIDSRWRCDEPARH